MKNCSGIGKLKEIQRCGNKEFRCGDKCLDKEEIVQFRTCNKQCISVHKICMVQGDGGIISRSKIDAALVAVVHSLFSSLY